MRGDLRRSGSSSALLGEPLFDLLTPRTRRLKILLRVASDLRLTMRAALDFITQPLQVRGQLRTINRRRVLLRLVKFLRLQRPRFALRRLRHVEDHRVRVQLRRGVSIDRTAAVVLELRHHPRARRLCRCVAADARLRVLLHLIERNAHALPMRFFHAVVAANQRRQRYRFRRAERRIPPRPVLHRVHCLALLVHVLPRLLTADQRLARGRMLAFGEPRELLFIDLAAQSVTRGKLALPLAPHALAFGVVILLRVGELRLVIRLRLAR